MPPLVKHHSGIWIRSGNPGYHDAFIVAEVYVHDAYQLRRTSPAPSTILDIGAHIGVFAVLAHELWPDARIACVEPQSALLPALQANVGHFAAIIPKAVWSHSEAFLTPTELGYDAGLSETGSEKVDIITLSEVMDMVHMEDCDLLKMDCEKCEYTFRPEEVARVGRIIGEWHDEPLDLGPDWVMKNPENRVFIATRAEKPVELNE